MQNKLILATVAVALVIAAYAQAAFAAAPGTSGTGASVACKQLHHSHLRCTMTVKGGTGISGTVSMRVMRGKQLVAFGQGRVRRGRATLTMRLLRRMPRGHYTVAMVLTIQARRVLLVG